MTKCTTPSSTTVHVVEGRPEIPQDDHGGPRAAGSHGNTRDARKDAAERRAADRTDRGNARQYPHLHQECSPTPSESMASCNDTHRCVHI